MDNGLCYCNLFVAQIYCKKGGFVYNEAGKLAFLLGREERWLGFREIHIYIRIEE
jgi:hypothetical protein